MIPLETVKIEKIILNFPIKTNANHFTSKHFTIDLKFFYVLLKLYWLELITDTNKNELIKTL